MPRDGRSAQARAGALIGVALLGLILFCFRAGARDLWNPDEPRYARIAAEMIWTGDPVNLRFNGKPYREKPPFYFWLVAAATRLAGLDYPDTAAAVLPSGLAALACLLLLHLAACRHYGPRTAMSGVLIAGTSGLFLWLARRAQLDVVLTAACTAAVLALYEAFTAPHWRTRRYALSVLGAGAAVGVATLTKFHGYLPILAGLIFVLYSRDVRKGQGLAAAGLAALIGLALSGWWFVLAGRGQAGVDLAYQMQRVQNWRGHLHGPLYFFYVLPAAVLPWTLLGAEALVLRRREVRDAVRTRSGGFTAFAAVWVLTVFVFFSIPQCKRELYILPALPLLGLLIARGIALSTPLSARTMRLGVMRAGPLTGAVTAVLGVGLLMAAGICRGMEHRLPGQGLFWVGLVALAGGLLVWGVGAWSTRAAVWSIAVTAAVGLAAAWLTLVPWFDARKSSRHFCAELMARAGPSPRIAFYDQEKIGSFVYHLPGLPSVAVIEPFYGFERDGKLTELPAEELRGMTPSRIKALGVWRGVSPRTWDQVEAFLAGPSALIVFKEAKFRSLPQSLRDRIRIVLAEDVSDDIYYVAAAKTGPADREGTR